LFELILHLQHLREPSLPFKRVIWAGDKTAYLSRT